MGTIDEEYWGSQMALFEGGREWIVVEFTTHFAVEHDQLQIGVMMKDGYSGELIGYEVPTCIAGLANTERVLDVHRRALLVALRECNPFP